MLHFCLALSSKISPYTQSHADRAPGFPHFYWYVHHHHQMSNPYRPKQTLLRWKLGKISCQMVFCWGTHMGVFSWSRHRWKDVSLRLKGYVKDWFTLHWVVEFHLSWLHRKKHTKIFWWCSGGFLLLLWTHTNWQSDVSWYGFMEFWWDRFTWWSKVHRGHTMFGGKV